MADDGDERGHRPWHNLRCYVRLGVLLPFHTWYMHQILAQVALLQSANRYAGHVSRLLRPSWRWLDSKLKYNSSSSCGMFKNHKTTVQHILPKGSSVDCSVQVPVLAVSAFRWVSAVAQTYCYHVVVCVLAGALHSVSGSRR